MSDRVEQQICIKFCVKLEHSSVEAIWVIQKATAVVNWWFILTMHLLMHHISSRGFWWNIKSPRWLSPLWPRFGTLLLLAFPKTKITFEREEISDHRWDSGKYNGAADGDWENCVRSQREHFEGDWGNIVLCTMFLVSSSINVSIFHITWLETFWKALVYKQIS